VFAALGRTRTSAEAALPLAWGNPVPVAEQEARGKNGEIALPPMVAGDGVLSHSPFRTKTDVELPVVGEIAVREVGPGRVRLGWPVPAEGSAGFEVETRGLTFNKQAGRMEGIWFPCPKVRIRTEGTALTAEIRGLKPDSFYWFRVVATGPEGRHGLPSREIGARTTPFQLAEGVYLTGGVAGMVLLAVAGVVFLLKREGLF
jgi:hypothetical protein